MLHSQFSFALPCLRNPAAPPRRSEWSAGAPPACCSPSCPVQGPIFQPSSSTGPHPSSSCSLSLGLCVRTLLWFPVSFLLSFKEFSNHRSLDFGLSSLHCLSLLSYAHSEHQPCVDLRVPNLDLDPSPQDSTPDRCVLLPDQWNSRCLL